MGLTDLRLVFEYLPCGPVSFKKKVGERVGWGWGCEVETSRFLVFIFKSILYLFDFALLCFVLLYFM